MIRCDLLYEEGDEKIAKELRKVLDNFHDRVAFISSRTYVRKPFPKED